MGVEAHLNNFIGSVEKQKKLLSLRLSLLGLSRHFFSLGLSPLRISRHFVVASASFPPMLPTIFGSSMQGSFLGKSVLSQSVTSQNQRMNAPCYSHVILTVVKWNETKTHAARWAHSG